MILKLTPIDKKNYVYINVRHILYFEQREKSTYICCKDDFTVDVKETAEQIYIWINCKSQSLRYEYPDTGYIGQGIMDITIGPQGSQGLQYDQSSNGTSGIEQYKYNISDDNLIQLNKKNI